MTEEVKELKAEREDVAKQRMLVVNDLVRIKRAYSDLNKKKGRNPNYLVEAAKLKEEKLQDQESIAKMDTRLREINSLLEKHRVSDFAKCFWQAAKELLPNEKFQEIYVLAKTRSGD